MTVFIQNDATGAGTGNLNPNQAAVDLAVAANGDTGLGLAAQVGNRQQVTYARTLNGAPPIRLNTLVNTTFTPNYGGGPQTVNIVVLPVNSNFFLNDGTSILVVGGTALPPQGSGLAGAALNNTNDCLVIYDTTQNNGSGYCTARNGTGGTLDLQTPNPIILYHELSHAFRIVNNTLLALTAACNPSSPEENAAITDENDLRTQVANATGVTPVLRDPGIHCGGLCTGGGGGGGGSCCIIASVASNSPISAEVQALREVRDGFLRRTEVGFSFFQKLLHDYYAFSPQVSTVMAQKPDLSQLVLEGYVRPLIITLRLLQLHAFEEPTDAKLGRVFTNYHPEAAEAADKLALLDRARAYSQGEIASGERATEELAQILHERAWSSEHVRWALIEPVRIYGEALGAYVAGSKRAEIGRTLRQAFVAWAAEMPLDHVWASLSANQLKRELSTFETGLLRSSKAKSRFRKRLVDRFGHLTAVGTLLGRSRATQGGNL